MSLHETLGLWAQGLGAAGSPGLCLTCHFLSWWQTPEELDDSDFETEDFDVRSRTSVQTEDDQLIAGQSARVRTCPADLPVSLLFLTFSFPDKLSHY